MNRTDIAYGQLDKVLRVLGFSCRQLMDDPPARVYEHKQSSASITLPAFPECDQVLDYHLVAVRTMLDLNGIATPRNSRPSSGGLVDRPNVGRQQVPNLGPGDSPSAGNGPIALHVVSRCNEMRRAQQRRALAAAIEYPTVAIPLSQRGSGFAVYGSRHRSRGKMRPVLLSRLE